MRYKKRTGYEKGLVFRPLLIGQFTRRAFSWLPIIRVSLSHEKDRISYIKRRASSNAPHLRDKRTKLVVTNIAKREGMSNEILFESSFSLKIPFVSRNGGKGTRVSLRYTLRQGARRESARGGEGG